MTKSTTYIVTEAPGHHGDRLTVFSSHRSADAARKAGADAADAIYYCDASTSVEIRLGKLEDVQRAEGEEIGLRVFVGQRLPELVVVLRTAQNESQLEVSAP